MRSILCIGSNKTGKSIIGLVLASILCKLDKSVAFVDATENQNLSNFFKYNFDIEPKDPLLEKRAIIRNDIEIFFTEKNKFTISKVRELNLEKYDYVFIEADKTVDKDILNSRDLILLFQDCDISNLADFKSILSNINGNNEVVFVLNKMIEKFDVDYFFNELISFFPGRQFYFNSDRIKDVEIPFVEHDYCNILLSKYNGTIKLEKFTDEFKASLYDLINTIEKIDYRIYRKVMK